MIHTANFTMVMPDNSPLVPALRDLSQRPCLQGIKLYPPRHVRDKSSGLACPTVVTLLHLDFLRILAGLGEEALNVEPLHLSTIKAAVDAFLWPIGLTIEDFTLTRIDYAQSVQVEPEERDALLAALQLARTRGGYTVRADRFKTTIYAKSKSKAMQVYDKLAERENKGFAAYPYEQDVVRAEVQVKRGHLCYKQRQGIPRTWDTWVNETRYQEYIRTLTTYIYRDDFFRWMLHGHW